MTFNKWEHPNQDMDPLWKLQVKGNLFVCPQIWTVASLTYKKWTTKECLRTFYFQIFFPKAIFSTVTPYFFKSYFENLLYLFTEIEYGKAQTRSFSAMGPETGTQIK